MPDTVLDDLYFGKLRPWEEMEELTPEMQEATAEMNAEIQSLDAHLSEEAKRIFEDVMSSRAYLECLRLAESFKMGFRLGGQKILSVLSEKGVSALENSGPISACGKEAGEQCK